LEGFQNPELVSHNNSLSIAQLFIQELSKLRTGFQPTTTAFTIFKESITSKPLQRETIEKRFNL
jgi:hypothetical protein